MKFFNLLLSVIFSAIILNPTLAQNNEFANWDDDGDELIEREEFTSKFIDMYFSSWDADNTRGLVEEGFFEKTYAGLDTDNDNMLSDEEWLIGYNYFYDDYLVYGDIGYADINGDGMVSYDEYYEVMYDTNFYTDTDLDGDNYISEYELANYVFENWDFDESGAISPFEFKRFDNYYLDV